MSGEVGLGTLPDVAVDADAGDIFKKLQMAAMIYLEAGNDSWTISSDLIYMNLNQEITPGTLINSGSAGVKQLIWEIAGLYRISSTLETGIGGRFNSIESDLKILRNDIGQGTTPLSSTLSNTWFDPVLIARISKSKDLWAFQFRGDIGGFGIGSKLTWQVQIYAGYRFSELFQLSVGYRILGMDYEDGSGEDRFRYNMSNFGPVIRLGFNF